MQTIEEIVKDAVEKKRLEDHVSEEKMAKCADEFINSLAPAIAQLLFARSNYSSWMDFSFRLPTGGILKAELSVYSADKIEWKAWIFNPNLEAYEFSHKHDKLSDAMQLAIYANNLRIFLVKKGFTNE